MTTTVTYTAVMGPVARDPIETATAPIECIERIIRELIIQERVLEI